jgi:hypothetical protein
LEIGLNFGTSQDGIQDQQFGTEGISCKTAITSIEKKGIKSKNNNRLNKVEKEHKLES